MIWSRSTRPKLFRGINDDDAEVAEALKEPLGDLLLVLGVSHAKRIDALCQQVARDYTDGHASGRDSGLTCHDSEDTKEDVRATLPKH